MRKNIVVDMNINKLWFLSSSFSPCLSLSLSLSLFCAFTIQYVMELAAHDYWLQCRAPSEIASAVVAFCRALCGQSLWTATLGDVALLDDVGSLRHMTRRLAHLYRVRRQIGSILLSK